MRGNTHYAVVVFSGDPAGEHDDPDLRGQAPSMTQIACGPEEFCWAALEAWTAKHPLREWESGEVLARDPKLAADGAVHITCPKCGRTSFNLNDVREGYCGHCHEFTGTSE